MKVTHLDHLVLTVADIDATMAFYTQALGMKRKDFGEGRVALTFGQQKINLHEYGKEFEPKADKPTPGSADLCFIADTSLDAVVKHLSDCGIAVIEGPVQRTGACGPILSIYFRDPDMNLIEVANLIDD